MDKKLYLLQSFTEDNKLATEMLFSGTAEIEQHLGKANYERLYKPKFSPISAGMIYKQGWIIVNGRTLTIKIKVFIANQFTLK